MTLHLHGTWEEIQQRAEEFRGKMVALTVYDQHEVVLDPEKVDAFFDKLDRMEFEPPTRVNADPAGDMIAEKYRKQGLDI